MMSTVDFDISARWAPRVETPVALAHRWLATVRRLHSIDPVLARWYKGVDGRGVEVPLDRASIERNIAAGAMDDGYMFNVKSDLRGRGACMFEFGMMAGSAGINAVSFGTDYHSVPDPSICTYRIFKPALLALAESFDAERAFAYPTNLSAFWSRPPNVNPTFPIAWISYVAPRVAHLVEPPSTSLVEHRPDGGLLMAATSETFDVDNPAHMAVARDIERAVAPLHLRPWEPANPKLSIITQSQ